MKTHYSIYAQTSQGNAREFDVFRTLESVVYLLDSLNRVADEGIVYTMREITKE